MHIAWLAGNGLVDKQQWVRVYTADDCISVATMFDSLSLKGLDTQSSASLNTAVCTDTRDNTHIPIPTYSPITL